MDIFKKFRNGLIYFSVGLVLIYLAQSSVPESLKQEAIVLVGLLLCGFGFIYGMLAYIRLLISRIIQFINK